MRIVMTKMVMEVMRIRIDGEGGGEDGGGEDKDSDGGDED